LGVKPPHIPIINPSALLLQGTQTIVPTCVCR